MALLYRRADVELATRDSARAFHQHLRKQARAYRTAIVCLLVLLGITIGLVWYRHSYGPLFPQTVRVDEGVPSAPFVVDDLGPVPAEGIARRWRITLGPEQPIPRWHPTATEQMSNALLFEASRVYRIRADGRLSGTLGSAFSAPGKPAARSPDVVLPHEMLLAPEGVPVVPPEAVTGFLRWTPDDPSDGKLVLLIEELAVPLEEYRDYLNQRGIDIRHVFFDP